MWHVWSFLPLALALSMDGLGVGITYGMRRIRLPVFSTMMIAGCSGFVFYLSMILGGWIAECVSLRVTKWIGAMMLIVLGGCSLFEAIRKKVISSENSSVQVYRFELRYLGLVIEILRSPVSADRDRSGSISLGEAFFLGLALSLDSLGAGLAASMMGLLPGMCSVMVGVMSGLFIRIGMCIGLKYAEQEWGKTLTYFPGIILLGIGVLRLFC